MSRREVYLIDDLGDAPESNLSFVDQEDLNDLLDEGYKIKSSKEKEIKGIKCKKIELSDGKDVSIVGGQESANALSVIGDAIADGLKKALIVPDSSSHLGAPVDTGGVEGMQAFPASVVQQAFDNGTVAFRNKKSLADNPFDPESDPGIKWAQGFSAGMAAPAIPEPNYDKEQLKYAEREGYAAAKAAAESEKDGEEIPVACNYRGKMLEAWKEGFERGGGTIK
jgi:hypothetical protein